MSALRSKRGASPVSRKRRCSGGARRGFHPLGLLALGLGTAVLVFGSAWHSAPLRAWPVRPDAGRAARGTASGPPLYSAAGEPADSIQFENPLSGVIKPGETRVLKTASLVASGFYSVEVSLDSPSKLTPPNALVPAKIASPITFNVVKEEIYPPQARVEMKFDSPGNPAIAKGLHAGDPGSYFIVRAAGPGAATLTLTAPDSAGGEPMGFRVALRPLRVGSGDDSEIVPNTARDWKHAAPMTLGKTVFGSADDIEYFYNTDEGKNGWQWLTF